MKSDSPLVIPILFWIAGLIFQYHLALPWFSLIIPAVLIIISAIILNRLRFILLLTVIFFAAALRLELSDTIPVTDIRSFLQERTGFTQPLKGRILGSVTTSSEKAAYEMEIDSIREIAVSGKLRYYTDNDSLVFGDIIEVVAKVITPGNVSNPNAFDFRKYMEYTGTAGYAFGLIPENMLGRRPEPVGSFLNSIRGGIGSRINSRFGENSGFVRAILIGDKSRIENRKDTIQNAGLSHLLAVSGLHVGIIGIVIMSLLKLVIPNRNLCRMFLMIILLFFASLCRWAPSVSRAVLMISLYLTARILQRRTNPNNILFLSLLIITAIKPDQLFSPGFQLSYIAVFVLLNFLPEIMSSLRCKLNLIKAYPLKKVVEYLIIIPVSSFILILFLSPVIAVHFHQFNLNGVLGNLVAIPLVSLILPLAILIMVLPLPPARIYLYSFDFLMQLFDNWVEFSSSLPLKWNFITLSALQVILIYIALMIIYFFIFNHKCRKITAIVFPFMMIILTLTFFDRKIEKSRITCFDCGLGDLILIETPEKETIMIDCGPGKEDRGYFLFSTLPYLQEQGIGSIDWLLITHAHLDHYGGVSSVFAELEVKNLVITDDFQTRNIWYDIEQLVVEEGCNLTVVKDTMSLDLSKQKFRILHPRRDYYHENKNNMSLVCRLDVGEFTILFTGDLEEEGEEFLLSQFPSLLDCDFLKVGHHGSKTSSSNEFLKRVTPISACISTSLENRFGFPHEITLEKYAFLDDLLFITGRDGAVMLETDGEILFLNCMKSLREYQIELNK